LATNSNTFGQISTHTPLSVLGLIWTTPMISGGNLAGGHLAGIFNSGDM